MLDSWPCHQGHITVIDSKNWANLVAKQTINTLLLATIFSLLHFNHRIEETPVDEVMTVGRQQLSPVQIPAAAPSCTYQPKYQQPAAWRSPYQPKHHQSGYVTKWVPLFCYRPGLKLLCWEASFKHMLGKIKDL